MQKRSLTIASHRTSIALEPEFWTALEHICSLKNMKIVELIVEIDKSRNTRNLSSAIRSYCLKHFWSECAALTEKQIQEH